MAEPRLDAPLTPLRSVLVVAQEERHRRQLTELLQDTELRVAGAVAFQAGVMRVRSDDIGCVVVFERETDTHLRDDYYHTLDTLGAAVVMVTELDDEQRSIELFACGVQDHLAIADASPTALARSIRHARERKNAACKLEALNAHLVRENTNMGEALRRDPLTELLNRRGLASALEQEQQRARRSESQCVVLFLDLDDFKGINDKYGHSAGDVVLTETARAIQRCVRPVDHVSRVGGDEFLVLLTDLSTSEAARVAERVRDAITNLAIPCDGGVVSVSCSVGCAAVRLHDTKLPDLLKVVGTALRQSKELGKDAVSIVTAADPGSSEMTPASTSGLILTDLVMQLEHGECLRVAAQPICDLGEKDRNVVAYELLVRGPVGPYESPDAFLHLTHGVTAARIDLACLQEIFESVPLVRAHRRARLHVNVFPNTLVHLGAPAVARLLKEISRRADRLCCIELSERHLIGSLSELREWANTLDEAGIPIVMDEIRFSRRGLEALAVLRPQFFKVDRQLFVGLDKDPAQRRSLRRIAELARNITSTGIVVGVESQTDVDFAVDLGFRFAQGYHLGRPKLLGEA